MSYLDQILDQLGEDADKCIYELYLQNHLEELCDITVDDFEDVYFALFDDNVSDLEEENGMLFDIELYDDYKERMDILYKELLYEAGETYSYVRFLCEIDKKQWADIIERNMEVQKTKKDVRIFEYYNKLRNGRIIKRQIPG